MNLVNKGSPKRKTSVHVLNRKWGTKQGEKGGQHLKLFTENYP